MKQAAIEVVLFKGLSGVTAQQMQAAAKAVTPILHGLPGFLSRNFGLGAEGLYVDIVHWQNMASAQSAAEQVMSDPRFRDFFALIDSSTVQMMHFEQA